VQDFDRFATAVFNYLDYTVLFYDNQGDLQDL